jgi:hypothetical protein
MHTRKHIVDDRRRLTLNGTWKFVMDPEGQADLDRMHAIFNAADPVSGLEAPVAAEGNSFSEQIDDPSRLTEAAGGFPAEYAQEEGRPGNGKSGSGQIGFHRQVAAKALEDLRSGHLSFNDTEEDPPVMLVSVPAPWQSQSPELCYTTGVGWYQRMVEIPSEWMEGVPDDQRIILGIDASDYYTEVWLNGIKVGENEGGYLPFEFDISQAVIDGENVLTVRVDDSAELFCEVPHGKQGWYGQLSGIWQPVWVERRSAHFLAQILINTEPESGRVEAKFQLSQSTSTGLCLRANLTTPSGEIAAAGFVHLAEGVTSVELTLQVVDPLKWSPASPHLYRMEASLEDEKGLLDSSSKSFGFRTIEARDGRLFLNGAALYLRGALDQDYYLDTIYTTPTDQLLEEQFLRAKELGLNLLRLHIKAPDPRYYDIADRMGMLIWTELPNWSVFSQASGQRGREMLEGILERDGHHPSIIIWTIINEDWGTDLVHELSHRQWLQETYHWLKALDPTRLVVDNSPCYPNFHIESDIDDYHFYRGLPDQRREWDEFVDEFAARPAFTYGPSEEITRTGKEPLILSEFGNWGLPDPNLLSDINGSEPWWFETGGEWTEGVVHPGGVLGRFQRLGLEGVFGSWKAFVKATQEQQFNAMKYELETLRSKPQIAGYVITELTDVHWECNGLLDMRRNPKSYHAALKEINADTIIIPEWERVSYWSEERVELRLSIAHGAGEILPGGELQWRIHGHLWGSIEVFTLKPGDVAGLVHLAFPAPHVDEAETHRMLFELFNQQGHRIASNYLDLVIYPHPLQAGFEDLPKTIPIYTTEDGLASKLAGLGYTLVSQMEQAGLVITGQVTGQAYSSQVLSYLEEGGRLLVMADRAGTAGPVFPGIVAAARTGTPWAGDWASSFSWMKRTRSYSRLPGGPLIDQSYDAVIPRHVLTGFKEWEFPRMVQAGIVVGWVHKPAVLVGERRFGKGKVILNSFYLPDELLGNDPTATALMAALIEAASAPCL